MRLTAINLESSVQTDVLKSRKGAIILAKGGLPLEEDKQFWVAGTSMHVPRFLRDGAV